MKISLFTNGIYPYVLGGMQKHSFNLAKYFAKNGILVREMGVYNLPNYIRVSLGTKEENQLFISYLTKFLGK